MFISFICNDAMDINGLGAKQLVRNNALFMKEPIEVASWSIGFGSFGAHAQ